MGGIFEVENESGVNVGSPKTRGRERIFQYAHAKKPERDWLPTLNVREHFCLRRPQYEQTDDDKG